MTWIVLISTITTAELQAAMLAAMATAGLPTTSWTKDGFYQNFVNWVAFLLQVAYTVLRDVAAGGFLETATGQALTDLAEGTYGTPRRTETFANGSVVLTNNSGLPLDEVAESISIALKTDSTITYRNSAAVYILNGNSATVPIVCDVAGTIGNAAAGTGLSATVELVTTLTGVTLDSNSSIVGQNEQSDESLRSLASKQAAAASTGHANKYEWYALNTNTDGTIAEANDGKTRCNINRASVSFENSQGRVSVTLASPSGPVDAGEYATTIAVLEQYALTNPGILIDANATAVPVNITGTVTLRKGTATTGVLAAINSQLDAYFPDTSIGGDDGFLTIEELELEIGRANNRIVDVTLTAPAADVALTSTQVATKGTVSLSITVQP